MPVIRLAHQALVLSAILVEVLADAYCTPIAGPRGCVCGNHTTIPEVPPCS